VGADAGGVLLNDNVWQAAGAELSGKQHCSPMAAGRCVTQQDKALGLLLASWEYASTALCCAAAVVGIAPGVCRIL